ncbi:hypothetical protein [Paraburkholderia tropica]|uniref:hypothetical protein n=1 Tax=Paraburkholderia tropica TaxID=92647 RepID=UPI003D2E5BD1
MKTPHTSAQRGTRVRVVLRDGSVIVDHFVERTGKFIVLRGSRLRGGEVKAFSIYRGTHETGK